jgi:hypothetical protein
VRKNPSTKLSKPGGKNLSRWNEAILRAKSQIKEIKRSIRTFESLRDPGMKFPERQAARTRKASQREVGENG